MTEFHAPKTIEQACELLAGGKAKILAGGTDLMIELRRLRIESKELPEKLVDVTRIPELQAVDINADKSFIGAAVTYRQLENDHIIRRSFNLLSQAASTVGSTQIRQTGTLGGNAGTSSPAGDGVAALTALGAKVEIVSVNSKKIVPIEDMITGPEKNILQPGELIVGFHLDTISERSAQLFLKVGRRQAVAVSRLNVSVILDEKLADPRIVLGSCFPSPRRLRDVETLISRKGLSREICVKAGLTAADEFINVCGLRSSAAYKLPAIREVVSKALRQSYKALENLK